MNKKHIISFIGLTHLSLVYGLASAAKGYKINFYDNDKEIVDLYNKGVFSIDEPGLNEVYLKYINFLSFSYQVENLKNSKLIFIAPDIETDHRGRSNLNKINKLLKLVLKNIKPNQPIIILSQVKPGFTRNVSKLHKLTYYMVETLIFGEALNRALNPERLIIGKSFQNIKINKYFLDYLEYFSKKIIQMNYESAELTKISINIYLATSVSTTNFLNDIANKLGASWDQIKASLKLDKRIGEFAYLEPGLGISGGNIERDLRSIKNLSILHKVNNSLVKSIKQNSSHYKDWPFRILKQNNFYNKNIGILGLTYKENTNSIKNSPSVRFIKKIIKILKVKKNQIFAHDPKIKKINLINITYFDNCFDLINNCQILVIMTKWDVYKQIKPNIFKKKFKGSIIIDPYQTLDCRIRNSNNYKIFTIKTENLLR